MPAITSEFPKGPNGEMSAGEGINFIPENQIGYYDFCGPMGSASGAYYGIVFQLPKWGFDRVKIDESIEVSPVFADYYRITIEQKRTLFSQIEEGLTRISAAVTGLDLILHDMRKYKEFLDYFEEIEKGKRLIKEGKVEEGEKLRIRGEQTIKSIFIDQVDVHTGEGVALKLIASRWPTIIADFMRLTDEDVDPKKIAEKYKVSEAEGVVLATKNKLYQEWRDKLFFPTIKERYENLLKLVEGRRKSLEEIKAQLKPIILRYRAIKEELSRGSMQRLAFYHPGAQAMSIDFAHIWAWKPFAPSEKYKVTRSSLDEIPALKAGFKPNEIEEIKREKKDWKGMVKALPQEPSIDEVVRRYIKNIEDAYKVKLTAVDLFNAREMLVKKFEETAKGLGGMESWVFSPYYIFIDLPLYRAVIRLPGGVELEDIFIENLSTAVKSQNVMILHCLEVIARDKEVENYVNQLLGEKGVKEGELLSIEEIKKIEYPEIFGELEKKKKEEKKGFLVKIKDELKKFKVNLGKFFAQFGWEIKFLRAVGPYEFAFKERITKYYFTEAGAIYELTNGFFKSAFKVP
jgi:hypothetical protein